MLVLLESFQQVGEAGGGEFPLEGPGGGVVTFPEVGESSIHGVEVGEAVGGETLSVG